MKRQTPFATIFFCLLCLTGSFATHCSVQRELDRDKKSRKKKPGLAQMGAILDGKVEDFKEVSENIKKAGLAVKEVGLAWTPLKIARAGLLFVGCSTFCIVTAVLLCQPEKIGTLWTLLKYGPPNPPKNQ